MTVMTNVVLVLKDSQGNKGIVKSFTDNDIDKISSAITDVGQVVDPATHMPIEATKTSAGVVQLATAQDITNGTAGKVVDAQELNNFAQTLPAANGVTDVSSGDNSNQLVVSRIGGSKTLTIDNVEHAGNADEATHATQADTATSANSVAWDNVNGKPSSYTPSSHTHDDRYYTESEIDTKLSGKANSSHTHDDRYYTESEIDTKLSGKSDTTHNHNSAYLGITAKAESAKSADSVAWSNVSSRPTKVSQFTNDSGYITSSGTAATISQKVDASAKTHTNYNTNGTYVPTMNFLSFWNGAYNSSGSSNLTYCAQGTIIGSSNIGSQSVNYANSAGSVAWANVSGKPSTYTPSSHTHDDRYYTESEIDTKLGGKADKSLSNIDNVARITIANNSMPSNTFDDLTLGASGTSYTAPADGYVNLNAISTSDSDIVTLFSRSMAMRTYSHSRTTTTTDTDGLIVWIPVKKGEIFTIDYTNGINGVHYFRFYYAVGSQSEKV